MEIERKFLVTEKNIPASLTQFAHHELEQAYIITEPVLRIRKKDNQYILTYKSSGLMARQEEEFPLTEEAYSQLLTKTEGNIISKTRYQIPENENLTIELDIFHGIFKGLYIAEVEFPNEEAANSYTPPAWFGREVTFETTFHNSTLSKMSEDEIKQLLKN